MTYGYFSGKEVLPSSEEETGASRQSTFSGVVSYMSVLKFFFHPASPIGGEMRLLTTSQTNTQPGLLIRQIAICALLILCKNLALAQIVINASGPCNCTGSASYSSGLPAGINYNLYDTDGNLVTSGTSANGNIAVNGLCPEAYELLVTVGGNTQSFYFNIPATTLQPGQASGVDICSNDGTINLNSLIPSIAAGGAWQNPAGTAIPSNQLSQSMTNGWYTYTVQSSGCPVETGVYVNYIQNADPGLSTTYVICETYVPFSMLDFMQGQPDTGGQWYDSNLDPMNGIYDPATMDSELFTYVISTVAGCNPVFATMYIDENEQLSAGGDTSITVCQNGTVFNMLPYLAGDADPGGTWIGPDNTPVSANFNPSTFLEGVYRYTIISQAPCVADISLLTIEYRSSDPSGISSTISVCETGANVNMFQALEGNPLAGGVWTNPQGQVTDATFVPDTETPGIYNYYYPMIACDPDGADLTITVESLPNAGQNGSLTICENAAQVNLNTLLNGAQSGGSWTNGSGAAVSNIFVPQSSISNYNFTYTVNGNLCPDDQATFTILAEDMPQNPGNVSLSLCPGDAPILLSDLYPGQSNISFNYPGGGPAPMTFDPSAGVDANYTVIIDSQNSCPDAQASVSLTISDPIFDGEENFADVCTSQNVYDLNSSLPAGYSTLGSWQDENGNAVPSIQILNFTGERNYHFILDIPSSCGGNEFNLVLTAYDPVNAGPDNSVTFCSSDDPVDLSLLLPQSAGGAGSWYFSGLPYTSSSFDPANDVQGNYLYVIPANGPCPAASASLEIQVQQDFNVQAGSDQSVCEGSSPLNIGGAPQAGITYSWWPTLNLSNPSSSQTQVNIAADVNAPVFIDYILTADNGVCADNDTVRITTNPEPIVNLADVYEICSGESATLSTSIIGDHQWLPTAIFGNSNGNTQTIYPVSDVNVQVNVENEFGCSAGDNASIVVHPLPYIVFDPIPVSSCSPLDAEFYIDLEESQNIDYLIWTIPGVGSFTMDTLRTQVTETGFYTVEVAAFSEYGCSAQTEALNVIEVYPSPNASFTSDPAELTTLDPIAQFIDMSYGAIEYYWTFDVYGTSTEIEPVFEFPNEEPANFLVGLRVVNEYGCEDSTAKILHLDNQYILFVPNTFTPDGDGINDVFIPYMKGFDESTYSLEIYDRWGIRLFRTTEVGQPWIGDVEGGDYYAKDDVYIWQIQVKDKERAEYQLFRGHLTLIR